ncbi:DUF2252 family protein [Caenispirillum salinarum]|uniref:DUF2252 family protein n=1 Tax=Caenispirillum salinarum TaxID=859058 RepID=UPI00384C1359
MSLTQDRAALIRTELKAVDGAPPRPKDPLPKHLKMARSPFRFFRGSAQLFYADLASGLLPVPEALRDVPLTRVQGDCHFSNFGFLTEEGSHGDAVIWCPNDYDDACMGRAAWDLLRFSVSLVLAAEYAVGVCGGTYDTEEDAVPPGTGPEPEEAARAIESFLTAYARACADVVGDPDARDRVIAGFKKKHALGPAERKARKRTAGGKNFETKSSLAKAAEVRDGAWRFRDIPGRHGRLNEAERAEIVDAFRPYVDDAILDVVRRLGAGTGSVDVDRFYLLVGPPVLDPARPHLNHVVEVKRQKPAAPLRHFPDISPTNRLDPAHLTVDCQRVMQRRPDMVLDEARWRGHHWLIRSRHFSRVGLDPEVLICEKPARMIEEYAEACGEALALAHARGDRRSTDLEAAMAGALVMDRTRETIRRAAVDYAGQVVEDWATLRGALNDG